MVRGSSVKFFIALCFANNYDLSSSALDDGSVGKCNGQPDNELCEKLQSACENSAVADVCPATCGACPMTGGSHVSRPVEETTGAETKGTVFLPVKKRSITSTEGQVPSHLVPPECARPGSHGVTMTIKDEVCYNGTNRQCGCTNIYQQSDPNPASPAYMIPPIPEGRQPLTESELEDEVVFAFIHINKAGGSTVKSRLEKIGKDNHMHVSHVGQIRGLQGWHTHRKVNWRRFASDFTVRPNFDGKPSEEHVWHGLRGSPPPNKKPLRFFVGGLSLGLCEIYCKIKGKCKCVYFTVLREPISRTISEYNYFCTRGAEKHKKWSKKEHRVGQCLRSLPDFMGSKKTSTSNFLVERGSRACDDPECGMAVSIANLRHPCMRYLLLDRLDEGMHRLGTVFGKLFNTTDEPMKHVNWNGLVEKPNLEGETLRRTKSLLVGDEKLYKLAEAEYEAQWDKPLYSCT